MYIRSNRFSNQFQCLVGTFFLQNTKTIVSIEAQQRMVFKMIQSVSTMGSSRPQRVVFSFLHLLVSLNLSFFSMTSSFPVLKLSHVTSHICHPTGSRDAALLLTTAGDHLPYAYMWESVCVVFFFCLIVQSITSGGVISLPSKVSHPSACFCRSSCSDCAAFTQMKA